MTYGLWQSVGGLQINEYRQAVTANNLANADTVGFKHDLAVVRARKMASEASTQGLGFRHAVLDGLGGGNWVQRTYHTMAPGDLRMTESALDAAIKGPGFFAVSDGKTVGYTRDGRFTQTPAGELVMAVGDGRQRVLDVTGAPIQLIPDGEPAQIRSNGAVMQNDVEVGRIGVVVFDDPQQLSKVGRNLFGAAEGVRAQPLLVPELEPGAVEDSTVNPTDMLASMIEVTRAYELNATMISLQDQTLGRVVNIGRVS